MGLNQAVKSLFLQEFVSAFFLAMRYFFKPKPTVNYPFEKGPVSPRFRGEHALRRYPNGEEPLHRLQIVRAICPHRQSRLKRDRVVTMVRAGPPAMTSTWSNASTAVSARKPVRWMRS